MDHYRESELNRFVRVGIVAVLVLAALGWYLRGLAQREVRADDPGVPRPAAAERSGPASRSSGTPDPDSLEARIRRWTNGSSGPQDQRPAPR